MQPEDLESLKQRAARARTRLAFPVAVLAVTLGGLGWRVMRLAPHLSRDAPEVVFAQVAPDGTVSVLGRSWARAQAEESLAAVGAQHPGAELLLCADDVRNPVAARLSLRSMSYGLRGGVLPQESRQCRDAAAPAP
jgi:hypothetical protein